MQTLRAVWMREPVVCFSIALGTVGMLKDLNFNMGPD